jgi:hypothetical protein
METEILVFGAVALSVIAGMFYFVYRCVKGDSDD